MRVGDLAKRTGLTVRALHHYDALGLVVPSGRTPAGHRDYADADVRRLYAVVALRRLGLGLAEVKALLDGGAYDPRETVRRQLAESDRRLAAETELRTRLTRLLAVLDSGGEPTTDDLLRAVEATTMTEQYYTPEQLADLSRRAEALGPEGMAKAQQDWADLIAEVDAARLAGTDPSDPKVQALADRWEALISSFTGGDPGIRASLQRLYDEQGPETASRGMVNTEAMAYMQTVLALRS
ncbi:MAG TPA: MerR family transcriptional regulator [Frankiaceae bacterium]|nr:MerR family transcriptional regulator [Frankiaceae bacterium]